MTPTFSFTRTAPVSSDTVVFFCADRKKLDPAGDAFDKKTGGLIGQALFHAPVFEGKPGQVLNVPLPRGARFKQAVILGSGIRASWTIWSVKRWAGIYARLWAPPRK